MKLATTNPHCFTYKTEELLIELLGGEYDPNTKTSIIGEKRTSRVALAHDLLSHSWDFDQSKEKRFALDLPPGNIGISRNKCCKC
jgi:hypothetical protein